MEHLLRDSSVGRFGTFAAGLHRGTRWYFGSGTEGLDEMVYLQRDCRVGRDGTFAAGLQRGTRWYIC